MDGKQIEYSEARGYNLGLAREIGLEAATTYNQLLFWQKIKGWGQWFYKSYEDMMAELPLSKYQLRSAYTKLESTGYIETTKRKVSGAPTLHFRILRNFTFQSKETSLSIESQKTEHSINNKEPIKHEAHAPAPDQQVTALYEKYLKYFITDDKGDFTRGVCAEAMKRYRLTPKRSEALKRRIKDAGPKMLLAAIVGYGRASWSNGNNDRRWKADLADFICRSYENVERGARLYEEQRNKPGGEDAWAALK